jgi:hypothetical protein
MPTTVGVGLVERAVDLLVEHLQDQLNGYIGLAYDEAGDDINLPLLSPDRFYISDGIEPLQPPAVFVVADRTEHDLTAQNFAAQTHTLFVALLAEDLGIQKLQRKVWRYGKALWLCLHDQALGDVKVFVRSLDYSPTIQAAAATGQRSFRKDVTLRCTVEHYERFR